MCVVCVCVCMALVHEWTKRGAVCMLSALFASEWDNVAKCWTRMTHLFVLPYVGCSGIVRSIGCSCWWPGGGGVCAGGWAATSVRDPAARNRYRGSSMHGRRNSSYERAGFARRMQAEALQVQGACCVYETDELEVSSALKRSGTRSWRGPGGCEIRRRNNLRS